MKIKWIFYLLVLGLLFVACDDDDDDEVTENQITITILEPADNEVISDCSDAHVHIEISASMENHEIEIEMHPEGDVDDKIIEYDEHNHDKEIDWEQDFDLCAYDSGTCFHLEVAACKDHDCEEKERAEVEFCLE